MSNISAFVGHSFTEDDKAVVARFLKYFDSVRDLGLGFTWDHAEEAEPKILSDKIKQKMKDKNLFIGLCTRKEYTISQTNLKSAFFGRGTMKAKHQDYERKTSDWLLQEIGFAVGKDISIILLLEEGVRRPGGLQGDLEHIPFNRNEPEKSFIKILEMLKVLIPKTMSLEAVSTKQVSEEKASTNQEKQNEPQEEPDETWDKRKYQIAVMMAILDKDLDRERNISEKYLMSEIGQGDINKIAWEALNLYRHNLFNDDDTLDKLKQLQQDNPEHSSVPWYLGQYCERYKEHGKAASWFWSSANLATNNDQTLSAMCKAAVSAANDGNEVLVQSAFDRARDLHGDNDKNKLLILNAFADVAAVKAESNDYIAFKEGIVDFKPEDTEARFSLAFKYQELKEEALSLYHYQLVVAHKDNSSGAWNNLGVAEANLGFNANAVKAYRKAQSLGDTLSMSNLAHRLIDAGFLDEAEKLSLETTEIENYDKQIGTAISKIKRVREEEPKNEQLVLNATKGKRTFYKEYAHACLENPRGTIPNKWQGPASILNVLDRNGKIVLIGKFKKDNTRIQNFLLQESKTEVTVTVQYKCTMFGRGLRFTKVEQEEGITSTILTSGNASVGGIMIISQDLSEIKVYEKGSRENERFYTLSRLK